MRHRTAAIRAGVETASALAPVSAGGAPSPSPSPRTASFAGIALGLVIASAVVSALGFAVELLHHTYDFAIVDVLAPRLSLSEEGNLPTWWASTELALCAVLLAIIAALTRDRNRPGFWVLAVGFVVMSIDEATTLHEHLNKLLELDGVLYFSWIIPAGAAAAVIAIAFIPFLCRLPRDTRRGFLLAGVLYLGGAIGMELPLGYWIERSGPDLGYFMIDWVEESLELAGATLFAIFLLRHLDRHAWPRDAS